MNEAQSNPGTQNPPEATPGKFFLAGRWWVIGLVAVVLAGQWIYIHVHRPRHLDAIAEECGNISYMLENEKPCLNHEENRLLFCHSTEKGMGVFLCDIDGGAVSHSKKLIFEEPEIHFGMGPHGVLKVFPWSPDDRRIVYAHQGQGALNGERDQPGETILTVCDSADGKEEASVDVPFGSVVALDWLDDNSFVYVAGRRGEGIHYVQRQPDGRWLQSALARPDAQPHAGNERFCSLAAISSNSIAWLQANTMWTMNVVSNAAQKLAELPGDNGKVFTAFDYSRSGRKFLVSCIESNSDSLWSLPLDGPSGLSNLVSEARSHEPDWNDAVWLNGTDGVAYVRYKGGNDYTLLIRSPAKAAPAYHFDFEKIEYFLPMSGGKRLLVVGDMGSRAGSGIWIYDVASRRMNCAVPASDDPHPHFKHVHGLFAKIQVANRVRLNALVFAPADYNRQSPGGHPVVITSIRYVAMDPYLSQYAEAVANAGGYFILIDHPWSQKALDSWAYYMDQVASNAVTWPGVDKDRVFLMSNSMQGFGLMNLLAQKPEVCRGAIYLVPPSGGYPEPSNFTTNGQPPRMLVTTEQIAGKESLGRYQAAAAGAGLRMDYVIHPGTPHAFIAKQTQRDRIKLMLDFIFED